jgi:hypothetical protein
MLFTDPCAGTSRLAGPRWWAKGMPPLWQADESIAAPKGHGPPDPATFPLQTGRF